MERIVNEAHGVTGSKIISVGTELVFIEEPANNNAQIVVEKRENENLVIYVE